MRRLAVALAFVSALANAQDLSALPDYRPETQVSGAIRVWGSDHMGGQSHRILRVGRLGSRFSNAERRAIGEGLALPDEPVDWDAEAEPIDGEAHGVRAAQ